MTVSIAVVIGNHLRAFDIGYRYTKIVIAYNPEYKWPSGKITKKFTIARYDSNVTEIDMNALK